MEFLAGVPKERVLTQLAAAAGNEVSSGKLSHPKSSAALCVNAFGWFLDRPERLPPLGTADPTRWQVESVTLEAEVRFPWRGGRHPWLDVLIRTVDAYIGVESKRYEPYRGRPNVGFSQTYWRDVWGPAMNGYQAQRNGLREGLVQYRYLDASQLIKHALGLRSATARLNEENAPQRTPRLVYLYATPRAWPTGTKGEDRRSRAQGARRGDRAVRRSGRRRRGEVRGVDVPHTPGTVAQQHRCGRPCTRQGGGESIHTMSKGGLTPVPGLTPLS